MCQSPLSLDNALPAALFRFGNSSDDKIPFPCHFDSCVAINKGSLILHQLIISQYYEIVASYEQFDDSNPFIPISLDCAILSSQAEKEASKLTAVVTYKTCYQDKEGNNITLSFGLGLAIKVNPIVGLTTFHKWKLIMDLDTKKLISKKIGLYFDVCFQYAATGLPSGVIFVSSQFIRPPRPN